MLSLNLNFLSEYQTYFALDIREQILRLISTILSKDYCTTKIKNIS